MRVGAEALFVASFLEGLANETRSNTVPLARRYRPRRLIHETGWYTPARGRHAQPRRRGVDADGLGPGPLDDSGPVVLLRRHGQLQERRLDDAPERHRPGRDQHRLGRLRLRPGV